MSDDIEALYSELRRLARSYMRQERPGHTLEATALVHEAVMRLGRRIEEISGDRQLVIAAISEEMRRVLIDHARRRAAVKRGGKTPGARHDIDGLSRIIEDRNFELIEALDEAFLKLEAYDEQCARVVRLRFYMGFTAAETAELMGVSLRTVHREWEFARAFLRRAIDGGPRRGETEDGDRA